MADSTISQLPAALTVSGTDLIPIDQGGVTKRAYLNQTGLSSVVVAPGKVLTVNSTITFTGTDGTTITFPATSASMARTDAAQSFIGLQTFLNGLASTTGNYSGQITSTVATGTAPFVIASTTPVTNLAAATAVALNTARTIDGVTFDGTANITVVAPATHAAPSKTTPVDADEIPLSDSAATFTLAKVTWANVKTTLKTYFDPIYAAIAGSASQVFSVAAATAAAHAVRSDQLSTDNANFPIYTAPVSWTPVDVSGAGLTLTGVTASIIKIGKLRIARCSFSFPVTASGASVAIGGLPDAAGSYGPNSIQGFFVSTSTITSRGLYNAGGSTSFSIDKNNATAVAINSDFSNCIFYATIIYETA